MKKQIDTYARAVVAGKILACKWVKKACARYLDDLKRQKQKGLYLDEAAGELYINFIEMLPHVKGRSANENKNLVLEMWQKFVVWNLFAWKWLRNGFRRFRHVYLEMPKKNGKSTFAAAIALAIFTLDGEEGAEIYSAATTRAQANEVFEKTAVKMWRKTSWLQFSSSGDERIKKLQYRLVFEKHGSIFEALSGKADQAEGKNTHCAIIDEYHLHKTDDMVNNLVSGAVRSQPLIIRITTAGTNKIGVCYRYRKQCTDVLNGIYENDTLFTMIFSVDDPEKWKDEEQWAIANPNWNTSEELRETTRSEFIEAQKSVSKEIDFKTKKLSIWTGTAQTWISDERWMASAGSVIEAELIGKECYGGLDLSKSQDITALCLRFPMEDGSFKNLYYYWVPRLRFEKRCEETAAFLQWERDGIIYVTEGDTIDDKFIREKINELADKYLIKSIAFDRHFSVTLVNELTSDGFTLSPFGQGFVSMGAPTSELERLVLEKKNHHGGNPVQRWMMSNVLIVRDPAGNRKIDKNKSSDAVDGPVAEAMAHGEYVSQMALKQKEEQEHPTLTIW